MCAKLPATLVPLVVLLATGGCGGEEELPGDEVDIDRDALVGDVFPGIAMTNLGSMRCPRTDAPTSNQPRVDTCPSATPSSGITRYQPDRRWTFEVVGTRSWVDETYNVYTIQNDQTGLCLTQATFAPFGQPFVVHESPCPTGAAPPQQSFIYVPLQHSFVSYDYSSRLRQIPGQDILEMAPNNPWSLFQYWHLYI